MKTKKEEALINQLLDLRKGIKGKAVVYIMIPEEQKTSGVTTVSIARPKKPLEKDEFDVIIRSFLEEPGSRFLGELNSGHPVWDRIVENPAAKTYYGFTMEDCKIELCVTDFKCILQQVPSENT